MEIVVCTTLAAYVMDEPGTWAAWLYNADDVRAAALASGHVIRYFAAIETDARGLDPFGPLLVELEKIGGTHWTFSLDDGRTEITTGNRLWHLTTGQNLAVNYATMTGADWMLFLAADTMPPADVIPKLLEVDHPLVGCEIPTYCLNGPAVPGYDFPVQEQLISAGAIFIRRDVFKVLRWRVDPDEGMTDDPSYRRDAEELLGVKSYVRKDCIARHYPETIGPIEWRFPGRDMKVYR